MYLFRAWNNWKLTKKKSLSELELHVVRMALQFLSQNFNIAGLAELHFTETSYKQKKRCQWEKKSKQDDQISIISRCTSGSLPSLTSRNSWSTLLLSHRNHGKMQASESEQPKPADWTVITWLPMAAAVFWIIWYGTGSQREIFCDLWISVLYTKKTAASSLLLSMLLTCSRSQKQSCSRYRNKHLQA